RVDAADPRHSESQARPCDILRDRQQCGGSSRPDPAHRAGGSRTRQPYLYASQSRRHALSGRELGAERDAATDPGIDRPLLVLFRPPYLGDAEPDDNSEIVPVEIAQDL